MSEQNRANIRLLCLDVDGVLTDGSIIIDDHGLESKRFHVRDGAGIRMWLGSGRDVAIITGRRSMVVTHRARELGIEHVVQGCKDKVAAFERLLARLKLPAEHAAVMGDDLPDLLVLRASGYPMTVADAPRAVQDEAEFITVRPGGYGAVREAIEHLLVAAGAWDEASDIWR